MIHYLLEFRSGDLSVTVHKDDDGTYVVTRSSLKVATCNEFPDALAVFRNHRNDLETRVLAQELGA